MSVTPYPIPLTLGLLDKWNQIFFKWKKLPAHEKNMWEEKAQRINEETLAKIERGELTVSSAVSALHASFIGPTLPDHVWECLWDNCDYMFEDQLDCLEHAVSDGNGHVASTFAGISTTGRLSTSVISRNVER